MIEKGERTGRRWHTPPVGSPVRLRLDLQRRAHDNLRRHVLRGATRFGVLVLADLAVFGLVREVVRAVRDSVLFGDGIAGHVRTVAPGGILNGWQYAVALFVSLLVMGCYGAGDQRRDKRRLFAAAALATALPMWMALWNRGIGLVLLQYSSTTLLMCLSLVAERLVIDRVVAKVRPPERDALDTLFVGSATACRQAMVSASFGKGSEYRPIGYLDAEARNAPGAVGHVDDFPLVLAATRAAAVVICGHLNDAQFRDVVDAALASGCQLLAVPRAIEATRAEPRVIWRSGRPLVQLTTPSLKGWQLGLKRTMDILCSLLGLLVAAPVMFVVAVAIKLDSPGPVLFGHGRLGLNGRRFKCYKFRSMRKDADGLLRSDLRLWRKYVANNYKLDSDEDPRLTRVGRFLRRTSIDELPQLINVLMGEMSLVGPRPVVPEEIEKYGQGAAIFLSLKPGMTGAWQVNGRSHVGYPDRVELELEYVRNWSLLRDLAILARTPLIVLERQGAF